MSDALEVTLARLRAQGTDDAHVEVKTSANKLNIDTWDSAPPHRPRNVHPLGRSTATEQG